MLKGRVVEGGFEGLRGNLRRIYLFTVTLYDWTGRVA